MLVNKKNSFFQNLSEIEEEQINGGVFAFAVGASSVDAVTGKVTEFSDSGSSQDSPSLAAFEARKKAAFDRLAQFRSTSGDVSTSVTGGSSRSVRFQSFGF
jgi:hypothetical protein